MRFLLVAISLFVAALLSGCGGGGDGTTPAASTFVSGTAAAGAPIVGHVSVRDSSSNAQPVITGVLIAADGKYSVDVAGLTAPFAFLADGTVGGKRVQLYSAGLQADVGGTINITPFTDLMVRNIAGTITTTLVDAIAAKLPGLTTAQLDAKRVELTAQLTPILAAAGVSTSIDLLRATFNADATGLDRVMDLVKVDTTVPTAVTITNILDANNKLTINPATGFGSTALSATGVTTTATTPLDLINQTFATFSAFFATSLPDPANPALLALFSSTFLDGGDNRDVVLTEITTDPAFIGIKFANVVVDSIDTATGIAHVHVRPLNAAGVSLVYDMPGGAIAWQMKREPVSGQWQAHGDQRIAWVQIRTTADKSVCTGGASACPSGTTYSTGLHLGIDNESMAAIGSAVVTGPGLPSGGLTLTQSFNQTWFGFPTDECKGCSSSDFRMTDTEIAAMGAAPYTYTVKLYTATTPSGTPLATYTEVVPAKPTLNSVLPTLPFPAITSDLPTALANIASGGTLTLGWSIPAGLMGDHVSVSVWQSYSQANAYVEADLQGKTATTGTAILVLIAPPRGGAWTYGNGWISAWEQNLGKVNTHYDLGLTEPDI